MNVTGERRFKQLRRIGSNRRQLGRYRGLEAGRRPNFLLNSNSVVVKREVGAAQIEKGSQLHN